MNHPVRFISLSQLCDVAQPVWILGSQASAEGAVGSGWPSGTSSIPTGPRCACRTVRELKVFCVARVEVSRRKERTVGPAQIGKHQILEDFVNQGVWAL
jgi:hypothetical protein